MTQREEYFLGHSLPEQRRLQQQAHELADESAWLFDQIGLAPGSRVVEIGCGPQGCLELLSNRVGPTGSVVGVELNDHAVELARHFLSDRGITNVEVRQGHGAATGLPRQSYHLATARLVLVNIPEPEKVVAEMAALVTNGGYVALHEADWTAHICEPRLPAWDRLMQVFEVYSIENGIDLHVGRRVVSMLRAAGLIDIRTNPLIHVYGPDHSRRPIFLQFVNNLRDRVVEDGLISGDEFAECMASLEKHLVDPNTFVLSHVYIQAWGRKPQTSSSSLQSNRSARSSYTMGPRTSGRRALDRPLVEREPLVFAGTCDMSGHLRGKGFPAADLPSRLKKGVGLACSQIMISAFGPIYETPFGTQGDVILLPDPETRVHVEFPDSAPESFYLGDIVTGEGRPWEYCPRDFLRRALADLKSESGLDLYAAFEQEFVFTGVEGRPAFAYALDSFRRQGVFGETFVAALRVAGVTPDSFLAEYAPRQFEVTSAPAIGVKAADEAVVTREMARAVAWRLGHRAVFAPMIEPEGIGNGTHIHFSLLDSDDRPAMYDPSGPCELSQVGACFVAGILRHLPALTAITAPSVASYFRLTPNRWAPTWANLGYRDRGASVRVCPIFTTAEEDAARQFNVEYRVADAAASPYMVLGALVHAGVDGIRKQMKLPPAPTNFWAMSEADRAAAGIARLPASLGEALDILAASEEAHRWFGEDFLAVYLQFKRSEIKALQGLNPAEICQRYVEVY